MSLHETFRQLRAHLESQVVGQAALAERLLITLLCDGHLLVEGAPGLAKTRAVRVLADSLEGDFQRIQFTPDLLPADLTGTDVYRPEDGSFVFREGPLFHNLVLADEINRAPAKVQSALLEAMGERQISVGRQTFRLPTLFMVMATQNPLEQEGTYPLPEAQLDRFLLHVRVDYPDAEAERQILRLNREEALAGRRLPAPPPVQLRQAEVFAARQAVLELHLAEPLEAYLVELVLATRAPTRYGDDLAGLLEWGASPRATLALERAARARAWLAGRDFVAPEDVQALVPDVLRHRILLAYEAEADGLTADDLITRLLARVAVP